MASQIIRRLLNSQRAQLFGLLELRGVRRLTPIYEEARAELEGRLARLIRSGRGATFTAYHLRIVLAQVYEAIAGLQSHLADHLTRQQRIGTTLAQRNVIAATKTLERQFTGHAPVLNVEQVAVLRGIDKRITPSLLDRFQRSSRLYGPPVVKKIRDQLALSLIQGEGVDEATGRVAGTSGIFAGERWRAERIARTELSYGFHAIALDTMRVTRERDAPDLKKTMVSTFDDRTGADSKEQHMQVREMDEPFEYHTLDAKGRRTGEIIRYDHPPNRPHDRATMIPWRGGWPKMATGEPGEVAPRTPSE